MAYPDWGDAGIVVGAGQWFKIACCDCGVVHDYFFEKAGEDKLLIKIERSERSTGQYRRFNCKEKKNRGK